MLKPIFITMCAAMILVACQDKQRTLLVARIESNLAVPIQLDAIQLKVTINGKLQTSSVTLDGPQALPLYWGVVQGSDDAKSVEIVATGMKGTTSVVAESATVDFVKGKSLMFKLYLAAECQQFSCNDASLTCTEGAACRPRTRTGSDLQPFDPNSPKNRADGGPPASGQFDGGSVDGHASDSRSGDSGKPEGGTQPKDATVDAPEDLMRAIDSRDDLSGPDGAGPDRFVPESDSAVDRPSIDAPIDVAPDVPLTGVTTATNTGSTTGLATNTNTGSTTGLATNTNTGSTTSLATNTNTGSTTSLATNTNTGSTTSLATATNTGSTTSLATNTNTGSTTSLATSTNTGSSTVTNSGSTTTTVTATSTGTFNGCVVGGVSFASGTGDPSYPCKSCQPTLSTTALSNSADGTPCLVNQFCQSGACQAGCMIDSVYYASNAENPNVACQACLPNLATTSWSAQVGGTGCPSITASAGSHSCAVVGGKAMCWGNNASDQLGINDATKSTSMLPMQVVGLTTGVQAIVGGAAHTCAIVSGGIKCWGDGRLGQLGTGDSSSSTTPAQVIGITTGARLLAAGDNHSCAIVNGAAWCWGQGSSGQLGNNSTDFSPSPVAVTGLNSKVQSISAGPGFSCAVMDGGAWCWGENSYGQLGTGNTSASRTPVQVPGLTTKVQAISCGDAHTCALVNGAVKCWGLGGRLGNSSVSESYVPVPVQVDGLTSGIKVLEVGDAHTCAVSKTGAAWCWGFNNFGRLGDGTTTFRTVPVNPMGLGVGTGVEMISAGDEHTCAVIGGGVGCWGQNTSGQVGTGTITVTLVPTDVSGLPSIR